LVLIGMLIQNLFAFGYVATGNESVKIPELSHACNNDAKDSIGKE